MLPTEAWTESDTVKACIFRFINAAVAAKGKDGKTRVYLVTLAREWTGVGDDFDNLYLYETENSYEVLPASL